MQLKRLLVNPGSAFLLAICVMPASTLAHADTIDWTNWSSVTAGNPGSATGTAGGITVTYSGQTSGSTNVPSWTPASTFTGGVVGNAPPHTPTIQIEGGSALSESITFSSTVVDPIFAIWSLGQTGDTASFDFASKAGQPFTVLGGGPSAEFFGQAITANGPSVDGTEGNGLVQFMGSFDSITFTTPTFENYYAFTVGFDSDLTNGPGPTPGPVPEPATLALFGIGLAALPILRSARSRRRS
jgi:hypothetical protein